MSLYELNYNLEYILNKNIAIDLIRSYSILNFSLIKELSIDIFELINNSYSKLIYNLDDEYKISLIKRYSHELGYKKDYLFYFKPIKFHISTFDNYNIMNEIILRQAGFWGVNPHSHIFIVNLEEKIKIINSFYYEYRNNIVKDDFLKFCEKKDIFMILFHTRKELALNKYFNTFENISSIKDCEDFIKNIKESQKKRENKNKLYDYFYSQNKFVDDIISLSHDIPYKNLKKKDFDNIKKVGKSSLHIVTGNGFYHKINICLFDNGDYYFVNIKEQDIITKNDIINNPSVEWLLLVNFIEFHLRNNFNIPSDINLMNHTSKYYEIEDKIMKQDNTNKVNENELKQLWSTGKLLIYEI